MKSRTLALIALFLVQLLYGINYTFTKNVINLGFVTPESLVILRVAGAALLFWLVSLFLPKEKIARRDYLKFFVAAIFGVAINMILFQKGLELTSPIHAATIITITPVIILLLSVFILNEKITKLKGLGVLISFAGAVILTIYGKSVRAADNVILGNIFVFINAISYSIYIILIKQLTEKYHPLTFVKWLFLFGLVMVVPFGISDLLKTDINSFSPYAYFGISYIVIGATFGTYLLNPMALSRLKASTVGVFIYLQPVIAGLFAILMGADQLSPVKIAAVICIFFGVYLVSIKPKQIN